MSSPFTIPGAPPELIRLINARRSRIPACMSMSTTPPEVGEAPPSDSEQKPDDAKPADKPGDQKPDAGETLGGPGLKALQDERAARKALEKQVSALTPLKDQMEAIAAAFGKKPDEAPDLAQQVTELQAQLTTLTTQQAHTKLVAEVVEPYDSLSAADVALVGKLSEREAMETLAKRLAEGAKPGIPKPDRSVGKGGSGKAEGGTVSAGRDLFRDRNTKNS